MPALLDIDASDEERHVLRILSAFHASMPRDLQDLTALATHFHQPPTERVLADFAAGHFKCFADPHEAARNADLVTTDVWTSMGFEDEAAARLKAFENWRVDEAIMSAARS